MRSSFVSFSLIATLSSYQTSSIFFILSHCITETVVEEQIDQISHVSTCLRTNQLQENTKQPTQPEVTMTTQTVVSPLCLSSK